MGTGSCQCGEIEFEIGSSISGVYQCYCETCRKLSGSVFSVVAYVPASEFKITTGGGSLRTYESTPGKVRSYCSTCFSPICVKVESEPDKIRIRLGVLDFEPDINLLGHIWVSEKPSWYIVSDTLPQYNEWPENA